MTFHTIGAEVASLKQNKKDVVSQLKGNKTVNGMDEVLTVGQHKPLRSSVAPASYDSILAAVNLGHLCVGMNTSMCMRR